MSTSQRTLRSGTSLWRAVGTPAITAAALDDNLRAEVAIIGGGITGALIGYTLAKAGVDVVIVDRDDLGIASTAASTGLLQYEIDTPLHRLIAKVGEASAVHAYRRGLRAIDEIEELVAQLPTDCGFRRRRSLCLASTQSDLKDLTTEFRCRRDFDFEVHWLNEKELKEISGFAAPAAMLSTGDAEIDPYRFTQELLIAAQQQGARIFSETTVTEISESASGVKLTCESKLEIRSKAAILCTGYVARELMKTAPGDLNSTYVVAATQPSPEAFWTGGFLIWETARPYFYARQTAQGQILIGGADTSGPCDHQDPELLAAKARELQARFGELLPGAFMEPEFVWAGTFAETEDGMPYIGRTPSQDQIYAALGYGGNGITFGVIAAKLLCDLFLGRPTPDAPVFGFDR